VIAVVDTATLRILLAIACVLIPVAYRWGIRDGRADERRRSYRQLHRAIAITQRETTIRVWRQAVLAFRNDPVRAAWCAEQAELAESDQ
jgi:hypothetical protein